MGRLRPRQAWGFGVLVAGAALVAVVAVTADGAPLQAPTDSGRSDLPDRVVAAVEVAVLIAAAFLLVTIIAMAVSGGRRRHGELRGRRALFRTLLAMAAVALLASVVLPRVQDDNDDDERSQPVATVAAPLESTPSEGSRPTWPLALLGGAVVMALVGAWWMARRRRPTFDGAIDADAVDDRQRAAVGSAFSASLADLDAEPDPRRAIVAAYARLLDGLAAAGFGRRPAEAPEEHLRRVLEQLRVPEAPLRTLVALFAEARFSEHPLTVTHKQAAIDAFRAARDALAGLAIAGADRP